MLERVLEPEVMDTVEEANDYDSMDHSEVNRIFVDDFAKGFRGEGTVLDVGTGTAQIPIEICRRMSNIRIVAIDMADEMLKVGQRNVRDAGFGSSIQLERCDAKQMPFASNAFAAVVSNSIVHHIPEPSKVIAEISRVVSNGGAIFVRDLLRPKTDDEVKKLVQTYAGDANDHQRQMFEDSLRAALTVEEMQELVVEVGFERQTVTQTSDRHWTWSAVAAKRA